MYLTMQRTKKANAKAESNPVKTPETMLTTITLEVILDASGVDEGGGGVVDKCFTVLRRQLELVVVLEVKAKKKSKSRERVSLYLFLLLLLLCSIRDSTNKSEKVEAVQRLKRSKEKS